MAFKTWTRIVCSVFIVSFMVILLSYISYKKPSSIPPLPSLVHDSKCQIMPGEIKSWMRSGLVTTVQPPVEANCQLLKDGNHTEQERMLNELKNWTNSETVDDFYTKVQSCSYVRNLLSSDNFLHICHREKLFISIFNSVPRQSSTGNAIPQSDISTTQCLLSSS